MRRMLGGLTVSVLLLAGCTTAQEKIPGGVEGLGEIADQALGDEQVAGHLVKALGQAGEIVDDAGVAQFSIAIDSVLAVDSCPARSADLAEGEGQFLVAQVRASMPGESTGGEEEFFLPLVPEVFIALDQEGRPIDGTDTAAAWDCYADEELLPSFIRPGQSFEGKVVLDSAWEATYVAYSPKGAPGWAWPTE